MIEIHALIPGRGHLLSTDCWCEPAKIGVSKMQDGAPCLIVEHDEPSVQHHLDVVRNRCGSPDWITRVLNDPTTKLLPPHDERNL